ncbi:MAG: DUF559 domain-containing protein [Anaeromyxobacter sp.]|nr:DUF559 domain-containing protein [Anaeromyxobacter sp.]MBL0278427.1 DUF559 domain-containing protein [Anaeromyxobacter sp.]
MPVRRKTPLEFRRGLRRAQTDAEASVWSMLRARRLGAKFRRQHTLGPYTLDFFCREAHLAVELDGGQHFEEAHQARDAARDAWLGSEGIEVLRFTDVEALLEPAVVAEAIWSAVARRGGKDPEIGGSPGG